MVDIELPWREVVPDDCEPVEAVLVPQDDREVFATRIDVDQYAKLPILEYSGYTISGRGKTRSALCGVPVESFRTAEISPRTHTEDRVFRYHNCKGQECPECYRVWAARAAKRAAKYIGGCAHYYKMRLYHVVVSVDPGHEASREEWYRRIDTYLHSIHDQSKGQLAYAIVMHPYRLRCMFWDPNHQGHYDDNPEYEVNPRQVCPVCGQVAYGWLKGMHWHIITNCYVSDMAKMQLQRRVFGLRYTNISNSKLAAFLRRAHKQGYQKVDEDTYIDTVTGDKYIKPAGYLRSYEDVFKLLRYELTHCEYRQGKHPIKYAGLFRRGTIQVRETASHWEPFHSSRDTAFYKEVSRPLNRDQICLLVDPNDKCTTQLATNSKGRPIVLMRKIIDKLEVIPLGRWKQVQAGLPHRFFRFKIRPSPCQINDSVQRLERYEKYLKSLERRVMGIEPVSQLVGRDPNTGLGLYRETQT